MKKEVNYKKFLWKLRLNRYIKKPLLSSKRKRVKKLRYPVSNIKEKGNMTPDEQYHYDRISGVEE